MALGLTGSDACTAGHLVDLQVDSREPFQLKGDENIFSLKTLTEKIAPKINSTVNSDAWEGSVWLRLSNGKVPAAWTDLALKKVGALERDLAFKEVGPLG